MEIDKIESSAREFGIPILRTESHKILEEIVIKEKPTNILEIGTAIGFSGIIMLKSSNAKLVTIEHNEDFIKQAKLNFKKHKLINRVKIIHGDALVEISKMLASKKYNEFFDFIFLDGPKAQYDLMLDSLLLMLKSNGTFVADNVLFRGYIEGNNTVPTKRYRTIIKRLDEFIKNCKNNPNLIDFELKTIEDGIIIAKKVNNEKK